MDGNQSLEGSSEKRKHLPSPLVLTQDGSDCISEDMYRMHLWPPLENAVLMLLSQQPGVYMKISYEEMYRCVYTSVCHQHAELIYANLKDLITHHLRQTSEQLKVISGNALLEGFHISLQQYSQSLGSIVPIFSYLNRFYITMKLKSDLRKELTSLFMMVIVEEHARRVLDELVVAQRRPFGCNPSIAAGIIQELFKLNTDFANVNPELFAKYIPNILPPTQEEQLPEYIAETQRLQQELLASQDFKRYENNRKRANDDSSSVR